MSTIRIYVGPMFKVNSDGVLERIGTFGDDLITQAAGFSAMNDESSHSYVPKLSEVADRVLSFLEKNDTTMYTMSMELVNELIKAGKKGSIGLWNPATQQFENLKLAE